MDRRDLIKGLGALGALVAGKQAVASEAPVPTDDCLVLEVGKAQKVAIKFADGATVLMDVAIESLAVEPVHVEALYEMSLSTKIPDLISPLRVKLGLRVIESLYTKQA